MANFERRGSRSRVIPYAVSLGNFLYDLAVAKEQLEQFNASLKPALTRDNDERD
jgi:hypothetical protein